MLQRRGFVYKAVVTGDDGGEEGFRPVVEIVGGLAGKNFDTQRELEVVLVR